MPKPKTNLSKVIDAYYDETIDRICNRLQKLPRSHYEIIDYERHQEREEEFLDLIKHSLDKDNDRSLIKYMQELAQTRSNEGYTLDEVQRAIDIIEEEWWRTIIHCGWNKNDIIEMLYICNRMFTLIRNKFATAYLETQQQVQKPMDELKERFFSYRHDREDRSEKE